MTDNKKIFATPKIRKFARELGANISEIEGSERLGRITEAVSYTHLTLPTNREV